MTMTSPRPKNADFPINPQPTSFLVQIKEIVDFEEELAKPKN